MGNAFECTCRIIKNCPAVGEREVQLKQIVQAALKAALHVNLGDVMAAKFDAQRNPVDCKRCTW